MSLSAVLKKAGHTVELIMTARSDQAVRDILAVSPDLVLFSTLTATGDFEWAVEVARALKKQKPDILTVFGSSYPTLFPEESMREESADIVCRGEGEAAILELCQRFDRGQDFSVIPNLWVRTPHGVVVNPIGPLIEDLDTLPFPDRELYQKYGYFDHLDSIDVLAGRGCPFDCHYCLNATYKELFREQGRYIRKHSPAYMIAQLKDIISRYRPKSFTFVDELFAVNKNWVKEFCALYRRDIRLPFICNVTVETVDDEIALLLASAGATRVCLGLETGNERLRREWLNKRFSNSDFLAAAETLHRHGLKFLTANMLGLPEETVEDAFETVDLNRQAKTDFLYFSVFQPYPGLKITRKMSEKGCFDPVPASGYGTTYFRDSLLKQRDIRQLVNLHKFFFLAVKVPALRGLIKWCIRFPPNWLFEQIFVWSFGWMQLRCFQRNPWQLLVMGLGNMKVFSERRA